MEDIYNVAEVIRAARQTATDISPADRQEWKMFCCALKVLGYDENTFVALSSCPEREAKKAWREERNPERYATEESAKAKIIALAKGAGMDLKEFRLSQDHKTAVTPQRKPTEAPQSKTSPQPDNYIIPRESVELRAADVRKTGLAVWLCKEFGEVEALAALGRYHVGASRHTTPEGYRAAAFPLINTRGECIDLKIMHLNPDTGSRKTAPPLEEWTDRATGERKSLASTFAVAEINKQICFDCRKTTPRPPCPGREVCEMRKRRGPWCYFGEHLLRDLPEGSAVAVVESEKTALVASIAFPEFIWIATGSISNLNPDRMEPLKPYSVTIFPDRDGAAKWEAKAQELAQSGYNVRLDITLSQYPGAPNDDLADIILRHRHGELSRGPQPPEDTPEPPTEPEPSTLPADEEASPWRLRVPEPDREKEPAAWCNWLAERSAWRIDLKEQCRKCCYAKTMLGSQVKGCRLSITDEEAASTQVCRGFKPKC